jgi:hypothetical protein
MGKLNLSILTSVKELTVFFKPDMPDMAQMYTYTYPHQPKYQNATSSEMMTFATNSTHRIPDIHKLLYRQL